MRIPSYKPLYLLVALAMLVPILSGCESSLYGGRDIDWTPGDSLGVIGPVTASGDAYDGFAPGTVYFYVQPHNPNWSYNWSVAPNLSADELQDGESFKVQIDTAGSYTVTVVTREEGEEVDGSASAEVTLPTAARQLVRMPRFAKMATTVSLVDEALADFLSSDTTGAGEAVELTVLAPTNEAFTEAFDADGDGDFETSEVPAPEVLLNILQFHVIPAKVTANDITSGASYETLEGDEVTFQQTGETISVLVDGTQAATITEADIPTSNGVIHAIDGVLLPPSADQ